MRRPYQMYSTVTEEMAQQCLTNVASDCTRPRRVYLTKSAPSMCTSVHRYRAVRPWTSSLPVFLNLLVGEIGPHKATTHTEQHNIITEMAQHSEKLVLERQKPLQFHFSWSLLSDSPHNRSVSVRRCSSTNNDIH